jgi:putative glutamine amidotransferase
LFAICRGHQLLNVALGGSLIVDLPSRAGGGLNHRRTRDKDRIVHKVALTPGSLLNRLTRRQAIGVNSTHHQAVGRVAGLLRATAVSPDGVIEAIEPVPEAARDLPWLLGVQFHPERLDGRHPEHAALFRAFASACRLAQRKRTL